MTFSLEQRVAVKDTGSQHHGRTGTIIHLYGADDDQHATVVFDGSEPPLPRTDRLPVTMLKVIPVQEA